MSERYAWIQSLAVHVLVAIAAVQFAVVGTRSLDGLPPRVRLPQGTVQGQVLPLEGSQGYEAFRGVRYALSTEGPHRFKRPRPIWEHPSYKPHPDEWEANRTSTQGVYDATFWGPSCPQFVPPSIFGGWSPPLPEGQVQPTISEDCLSASIFRPKGVKGKGPLPVLVWLYGGAWLMGADFAYNPESLLRASLKRDEPIIIVTFNYRVGSFGFLAGPAMDEQSRVKGAEGVDLNVGLHDQRAALRWIKRNIGFFGGDPNRITAAGESSGAVSISMHMLANNGDEAGEKLFHAAIMQSVAAPSTIVKATNFRHRHHYSTLLSPTPCANKQGSAEQIACLRTLSTTQMQAANTRAISYVLGVQSQASWKTPFFFPFYPVLDPEFLPRSHYDMWSEGKYMDIPFIMGNVLDEGTLFTPHDLTDEAVLEQWLSRSLVSELDNPSDRHDATIRKILAAYPDVPSEGSPHRPELHNKSPDDRMIGLSRDPEVVNTNQFKRAAAILGDAMFNAPTRYMLRLHADHHWKIRKQFPAWSFVLSEPGPGKAFWQGVPHATDNDYLWAPAAQYLFFRPPTDFRVEGSRWKRLADTMASAWVGFTNNHHPNGEGLPQWPYHAPFTAPDRHMPAATLQYQAMNVSVIKLDARDAAISDVLTGDAEVRKALGY